MIVVVDVRMKTLKFGSNWYAVNFIYQTSEWRVSCFPWKVIGSIASRSLETGENKLTYILEGLTHVPGVSIPWKIEFNLAQHKVSKILFRTRKEAEKQCLKLTQLSEELNELKYHS